MKRILLLLVILGLVSMLTQTHVSAGPPAQTDDNVNLRITIEPNEIPQGRMALIRVLPLDDTDISTIQAMFMGDLFDLYPSLDGDWVGFIGVDMSAERGDQLLEIFVSVGDSMETVQKRLTIPVVWGAFTYQDIALPNSMTPLLDPQINRDEFNELARVHSRITSERFFNFFMQPIPGPIISEFGGIRSYNNGQLEGRHTGVDFRAAAGTEVQAAADGRVIYSQKLPIHGNHVIVDHGWGIMTGYSHLSERLVVPGQLVKQGDIIGLAGSTGRSQGPHVHFEVIVNGYWVDPAQFLNLELPPSLPDQLQ